MGWKDELKKGQKLMRDTYMFAKTGQMPQKTNPNTGKLDLGHLRREAEENGFNALTVLRATGGQGSRYSEPAKLASSQFWNVFNDETKQSTSPAPQPRQTNNTITGKEILAPVTMSNGKLNSDQNTVIYDVEQDPVRKEYVTDGENVFSAKQKPLDNVWVDPWGKKWRLPFEDVEIDTVIMGSYLKALASAYNVGDVTGKALRQKLGQKFGWYGYPKPSAIKKSKLPSLSSAQFDNKLGIKKPIKGLTARARERQDRINQQMGW